MAAPEAAQSLTGWVDQYDQLLQINGLDRGSVLSDALQYEPGERPAVLALAQCLDQPALLIDQVKTDYPQASDSRAVRARISVLQQDLALNVIAPLTLRLFRDGQAPLPDPRHIFLASFNGAGTSNGEEAPASRWYQTPDLPAVGEKTFVRSLGKQARDWYPMFRQKLGISPGAYWSSIGLGLGAPFSAVWNLAEPAALCDFAQRWLGEFRNDANQFIDWIPAVFDGQITAIPQRKGCCLKYLLPEGGYCGTCGVYRKERLAALRRPKSRPEPGLWQPGQ
jgi:FhuF-like iron-sulfur protein